MMKFGRSDTSALSQVAWELPVDPPATQALLHQLPLSAQAPAVYIGCSVWTDRSFLGKVYPKGTPAKDLSLIHISEPTRPLYISYAVFCLKKKI